MIRQTPRIMNRTDMIIYPFFANFSCFSAFILPLLLPVSLFLAVIIAVIFLTINRQKKAHVQKSDMSLILYNTT
jgi:hypothetical protein